MLFFAGKMIFFCAYIQEDFAEPELNSSVLHLMFASTDIVTAFMVSLKSQLDMRNRELLINYSNKKVAQLQGIENMEVSFCMCVCARACISLLSPMKVKRDSHPLHFRMFPLFLVVARARKNVVICPVRVLNVTLTHGDFYQIFIKLICTIDSFGRIANVENKRRFVIKTSKNIFFFVLCLQHLKVLCYYCFVSPTNTRKIIISP